MEYALIAVGFVGLLFGGNWLVDGAVSLARRAGLSPMIIGLTLVGFGTSTPELLTSVQAAFAGSPGIAVGNIVGSNIANILLILGVAALLWPIAVNPAALRRDGSVLLAVTVAGVVIALYGNLGRGIGSLLVAGLIAYVVATIILEKRRNSAARTVYEGAAALSPVLPVADTAPAAQVSTGRATLVFLGGLAITLVSARLLVSGAVTLAEAWGVSEVVIGLTVVAVGTSLPELVTSVVAARKGESDVALGNIIGSNIFNLAGILGVTAILRPIAVPASIVAVDVWVMLLATVLLIVFARTGWRIGRREGTVLLSGYGAYLGWLVYSA